MIVLIVLGGGPNYQNYLPPGGYIVSLDSFDSWIVLKFPTFPGDPPG